MAYDFMENFNKNNERFKAEISKYIDEGISKEGHIVLGATPPVLALAGANTKLPLVIPCEQINYIIDRHYKKSNNYGILEKEDTLNLYESIINPICLISGSEKDTCVVITSFKNKDGINIQVPIYLNIDQDEIKVSAIATQYPNRILYEYIAKEILKHNLIAYNNKKLEDLLRPIGLLLPVGHISSSSNINISQLIKNVNSYDDSIIHNVDNIKYAEVEALFRMKADDNKYFKPTFKANFTELNKTTNDLGLGDATKYFIYGEELAPHLKNRIMWNSKNYGSIYTGKIMKQIANKLIENKTKEIDEKSKEVKNMLNNKDEIKGSQYDVNEINKGFDKIIQDVESKRTQYGIDEINKGFDKIVQDVESNSILNVKEFIQNNIKSKENLAKMNTNIKEQLVDTICEFEGETFYEKMINFYNYYKDIFIKNHKLSDQKGVGYCFAKDGNGGCLVYYDDVREFYGYEKEKGSLDFKSYEEFREYRDKIAPSENEILYEIYLKDVNNVCESMYKESVENLKKTSLIPKEDLINQCKKGLDNSNINISNNKSKNYEKERGGYGL